MKFLVLGGGAQGSAAAFDLLKRDDVTEVYLGDRDMGDVAPFLLRYRTAGKLKQVEVDADDDSSLYRYMEGMDAVLCALPYYYNLKVSRVAIACGAHSCDLGGNTAIVEQQLDLHDAARAAGVTIVPDCGLAPGMVNILAQAGIEELDRTESVKMYVGGLPQEPVPPLNYQIVYSLEGVIDYYTSQGMVLHEHHPANVEALSGLESVEFPEPLGTLEAFHTAGGISTMAFRNQGLVRTMEYKTLRYPGHAELMRGIRALGLFDQKPIDVDGCHVSPRKFFIAASTPKLRNPVGRDVVVLRVVVTGEKAGRPTVVQYDLVDYHDRENLVTAMMRTTGYSLAITALMQAQGELKTDGAETPDAMIPAEPYIAALAERGIHIRRTVS